MKSSRYEKFLIIGATGGSGKELVNELLKNNKKVAIVVRNVSKAKSVFKENYEKLERIVEFELGNIQLRGDQEIQINEELLKVVEWCDVLISSIGSTYGSDPQKCDYFATVEMINHCEKSNFKNKPFIYISTLCITRPHKGISIMLNCILPFVMGWKALAENRLRQSSLNYFIVRPGGLNDKINKKTIKVSQGDTVNGYVSRNNLARFIINSLNNESINKERSTIEVIESTINSNEEVIVKHKIKSDEPNYLVTADHFTITRNYLIVFHSLIIFLFMIVIWIFKN